MIEFEYKNKIQLYAVYKGYISKLRLQRIERERMKKIYQTNTNQKKTVKLM